MQNQRLALDPLSHRRYALAAKGGRAFAAARPYWGAEKKTVNVRRIRNEPDRSDKDLVQLARAGDQQAWSDLVDKYNRLVWHVVRGFRLSHDDATDVAQMTWLRAVEKLDSVEDPERIGIWLSTIARREALRLLGQRDRVVPVEFTEFTQYLVPQSGADEDALDRVTVERLLTGLSDLGDSCRQLVLLILVEPKLTYAAISEILGIAVGTIGPRRRRCFQQLRVLTNQ